MYKPGYKTPTSRAEYLAPSDTSLAATVGPKKDEKKSYSSVSNNIALPEKDVWGVIMRKDSPLANKKEIKLEDLISVPLIASRQMSEKYSARSGFLSWFGKDFKKLNIVATYNLVYNAAIMVRAGIGYAVTLDKLVNTTGDSEICFRPLSPRLESGLDIVWKKYQVFSPAPKLFLDRLYEKFVNDEYAKK